MTQTSWNTERVRDLLVKAREFSTAYGGRILTARLGVLLRRLDKEFHPKVLGDPKLVRLLGRYPDLGTIRENPATGESEFHFHLDETGASQPPLPGVDPTGQAERIDHRMWLALVSERAAPLYIDLQTLSITSDVEAPARLAAEPERYLAVPPIPEADIRKFATAFVQELPEKATRERLAATLEREHWFTDFTRQTATVGLNELWLERHRGFVIGRAREWLEAHGLKADRFITAKHAPAAEKDQARAVAPGRQLRAPSAVRKLVHSAIDRMTDDELLNLTIPLKYIIRR